MKVSSGGSLGHEWAWGCKRLLGRCFCIPTHCLWVQKVKMNLITAVGFWVSPPINLRSYNDKVPFTGPCHLPKKGLETHSAATLLFSMRAVSLVLLQSCRSVDVDDRCKRTPHVYWRLIRSWEATVNGKSVQLTTISISVGTFITTALWNFLRQIHSFLVHIIST